MHLRGETHINVRELRAALVYVLFGTDFCDDYHSGTAEALPYWDRAFAADSPRRQGELLGELARFDPGLGTHPKLDRYLRSEQPAEEPSTTPRYPDLSRESARRRAFFEWTAMDLERVAGEHDALHLAGARHLRTFLELPLALPEQLAQVCERLCAGISRLEDLPPQALDRAAVVPLRITPHTPKETAFWVEKPLSAFRLEVDLPPELDGMERLHRQAFLVYRYRNGSEERLRLGADLFHLLLDLAAGYQLGDVSSDDTFANLSIFVRRLMREDERELLAWNPMRDETIYQVRVVPTALPGGVRQRIVIAPVPPEGAGS